MNCPYCQGDLEQVDETTLYHCTSCDEEYDEDELNEG